MIELIEQETSNATLSPVSIKVIGIGGAGGNTVNSIIESGAAVNIHCIVANTDVQALNGSLAQERIQIGVKSTKGLGTGANPDIGERAAQEDLEKIMHTIGDADIVFLSGGMGGGTGSGAMPVIAQALKDKGILCIAIVTKPFAFEGKRRAKVADDAIERLKQVVDTLIIMPNQRLLEVTDKHMSMIDAFAMTDGLLVQLVRGLADIIAKPGHINVDFADVRAIMKDRGLAVMGTGRASGQNRAAEATLHAISSPLLENMSITGARAILFNITGGAQLSLHEIHEAASLVYQEAHEEANIIIGSVIDEALDDEVIVTIIATGFDASATQQVAPAADAKASHLLAEETVRAAHELVDALKAETERAKTVAVTQPALRDDEFMRAIVQEVLREVKQTEKTETSAQSNHETHETKESATADIQKDEPLSAREHNIMVDINDLDVPAYLRQEAMQEQK